MNPGDLVRNKSVTDRYGELGTFIGMRMFKANSTNGPASDYVCAEVMWFKRNAPNGDRVSTIQKDLIEAVEKTNEFK